MKICQKCGDAHELSKFSKDKNRPDGLRANCKSCNAAIEAARYAKNPERVRANVAKYAAANADAIKAYKALYHIKNAAQLSITGAAYRARNYESLRQYDAARYAANPAKRKSAHRAWVAANPHKSNALKAKYRAARALATPAWASAKKIEEFYFAADLLNMVTGEWHHVDHVVPLHGPRARSGPFKGERLVCGLHCEFNLQVIPGSENCSKKNLFWPDMP